MEANDIFTSNIYHTVFTVTFNPGPSSLGIPKEHSIWNSEDPFVSSVTRVLCDETLEISMWLKCGNYWES